MGTLGRKAVWGAARKAVWGAALALWVMVPAASASASNRRGKVDSLLQEASSRSPQSVIIRVEVNQAASAGNIVWGTTLDGDNIVWGTSENRLANSSTSEGGGQ